MTTALSPEQISEKLKKFFIDHLPITQFMGLDVESYDGDTLILTAPLEPNINDKQTAFGGSLYNTAVMACWGMIYLKTQERNIACNQVVTEGSMKYIAPVDGRIRAICHAPSEEELTSLFDHFERKGKARISLEAAIYNDTFVKKIDPKSKPAVKFSGQYVILKSEK
ncbi:MAG: thioesterase domain-containing protein [Oleispira sp.]|nr:thioesterase domain-containing protein [Oleispira sp.]MBL4881746.1 thioesterase domain-containing protein [Oleispira sp.]